MHCLSFKVHSVVFRDDYGASIKYTSTQAQTSFGFWRLLYVKIYIVTRLTLVGRLLLKILRFSVLSRDELAACSVKYTAHVTKIGGFLCAWGQAPISSEPRPPGCLHRISRSRSTSLPILWRASSRRAILPPAQSGRADFGPHFQPGKEE